MRVTKIEQQKRSKERYSIYVDDQFFIGVDEAVLVQAGIYKGMTLTQTEADQLRALEADHKVYNRAIDYLSYGLRTIKEMRDHLSQPSRQQEREGITEVDPDLIEAVINKLQEQGYLNDLVYAQSYVRTQANLNRKGPSLIRQELLKRGVSDFDIQEGLLEYKAADQLANASELASKYRHQKRKLAPKLLENRLRQYLLQRGYDAEAIQAAVAASQDQVDPEDEGDLLAKEADKQYRRLRRRYQAWDLKQRLSQALARKGFSYDQIQAWLSEHDELFQEE